MRGNRRVFLLVGLVIVALAVVGLILYFRMRAPAAPPPEEPEVEVGKVEIVIATNNLNRGMTLAEEHVRLVSWPQDQLPPAYYTDLMQVLGYIVRVDIPQGMPLMPSMLARTPEALGAVGSEPTLLIPSGKRAYAIPVDLLGAVAWTIQPGDHVDIVISWSVTDVDEEFQSALPNQYTCVGGEEACGGTYGRLEVLPTGQVVMVFPTGGSRSQYVAQMTIQDAVILGVGEYEEQLEGTARPAEQPAAEGQAAPAPAGPTTVQVVILVMDPQDVLVLKALSELQADIDLVLRAAGDSQIVATDPVSVEYIMARYGISPPPKLPYVVGPPTTSPLEQEVEAAVEAAQQATTQPTEE